MSTIVIKDLPENVDLDREAMRAIAGGARRGSAGGIAGLRLAGQHRFRNAGSILGPGVSVSRLPPKTQARKTPGK